MVLEVRRHIAEPSTKSEIPGFKASSVLLKCRSFPYDTPPFGFVVKKFI